MVSGIGSGIDVRAIVDGLMEYQSRGLDRMNEKKGLYQYQQKAYTELKNRFTDFHNKLESFQSILNKNHYKSQSSDENIVSVATTSDTVASGQYQLDVSQLAQAHKISSAAMTTNSEALMLTGDLVIETNGKTLTLNLSETDTLSTIRDNINHSENNPGVTASILKVTAADGSDEYRLLLSADETGVDHAMTLSGTGAAGLDLTHELSAPSNAKFTMNGFQIERSSNNISDVLDGVSFHLNGQTGQANITISSDIENEEAVISDGFQSIIDAYNGVMDLLSQNQSQSLLRDSTYGLIQLHMKNAISDQYGDGTVNRLLDIGVKTARAEVTTNQEGKEYAVTGKLDLDKETFSQMIKSNLDDVRSLFNSTNDGLVKALDKTIDDIENHAISNREKIIGQQTRQIDNSIYKEEARLMEVREHLINQYKSVEEIISRYDAIGNFLDQQLSLYKPPGKK